MLSAQCSGSEHFLIMGTKGGDQDRPFCSFKLAAHLSAQHLLHSIGRFLDLSDLRRLELEDEVPDHSSFSFRLRPRRSVPCQTGLT